MSDNHIAEMQAGWWEEDRRKEEKGEKKRGKNVVRSIMLLPMIALLHRWG